MTDIQVQLQIKQQIENIEKEIRETPYHKGTEHHIGKLRARIARLKDKLIEQTSKKGGGGGGGYAIKKQGDATVVLIGPPSAGKSTLINKLTNANSKVAPYAFTTVSVIPGMMDYHDAKIQILDVPGLIEGAEEGKGRGKEVLSVARGADLLIIMTDPERIYSFSKIHEALERNGIRINKNPPNINIDKKVSGGIIIHSNIRQELSINTLKEITLEMGFKNADITLKENVDTDRFIDALSSNRAYLPAINVLNKIDLNRTIANTKFKYFDDKTYLISSEKDIGLNELKDAIWNKLNLVRIYLVRPEEEPNTNNPIIMKSENNLEEVAEKLGTDFVENKKLAKIWGSDAKYPGQEVSLKVKVKEGMQVRFI